MDQFQPDEDDMILFKGTSKEARVIFPLEDVYTEEENKYYEDFQEYLEEQEIELPDWVVKRHKLRVLKGEDYKIEVAAKRIQEVLEWKAKTFPMVLTDDQKTLIDAGLFYVHGRDRSLRPITIFCPKVVLSFKIGIEDSLPA